MKKRILTAVKALRAANQAAGPRVREVAAAERARLTHNERVEVSRLLNQAREAGVTVTKMCEWYGTSNRKTVMDLLEYKGVPVSAYRLEDYLQVESVDEHQIRVFTVQPVPVTAWSVAQAPDGWEGAVVTDGVMTDDANALWVELKSTDLAERLGVGVLFDDF